MTICTIVARNYLAHARVLCSSFLMHHPGGKCYVLVLDADTSQSRRTAEEPFVTVTLNELALPEPRHHFIFQYSVMELATAVKPFLLRYLLDRQDEPAVLYLDPDILIKAPLDALFGRLESGSGVLLTPHLDTDYPEDGLMPNDAWILLFGVFNLGFLGVRRNDNARTLLQWLEGKLENKCIVAPERGYFVDQRFFDLAITLFPWIGVEYGVGYNVAYWNLHSRRLHQTPAGEWRCNDSSLLFYHFSNYDPRRPEIISGYLSRYRLSDRPDLEPLFEEYRMQLMASGYDECSQWPYGFSRFRSGQPISSRFRYFYRNQLARSGGTGADPFASRSLAAAAIAVDAADKVSEAVRTLSHTAKRSLVAILRRAQG